MELLIKHAWAMFIGVTILNAFFLKFRTKKYVAENPELEAGYNSYVLGWLVFGNIPWLIMMVGDLGGFTQNTFDFFAPQEMNPIVILFHSAIIVQMLILMWWIYFRKGAEFLEKHPGLLQNSGMKGNGHVTAKQVKIFAPLVLIMAIFGLVMFWITADF